MQSLTIAQNVARFKESRNPLYLLRAVILIAKQGRVIELTFGMWCKLFHPPSPVQNGSPEIVEMVLRRFRTFRFDSSFFPRTRLVECFSDEFAVASLPDDFVGARAETILRMDKLLIIGEYSDMRSARIAILTKNDCSICDHYHMRRGFFHIHCLWEHGEPGNILITTGEAKKILDLWTLEGTTLRWVRRLKSRLAGFTAATRVRDELYFGSDFGGRPNFLETLKGTRYFFPAKAYDHYVFALYPLLDRYVVSINTDLDELSKSSTLSIFDDVEKRYLYCDYVDLPAPDSRGNDTAGAPCSIIGWRKGVYPEESVA